MLCFTAGITWVMTAKSISLGKELILGGSCDLRGADSFKECEFEFGFREMFTATLDFSVDMFAYGELMESNLRYSLFGELEPAIRDWLNSGAYDADNNDLVFPFLGCLLADLTLSVRSKLENKGIKLVD